MSQSDQQSGQLLVPNWLILSHLLGAAVMLYFVDSVPSSVEHQNTEQQHLVASSTDQSSPAEKVLSVAELRDDILSEPSGCGNQQTKKLAENC